MLPNPDQLAAIARMKEGRLEEIPFAVLLRALADEKSTAILEIESKPLKKEIILEQGIPVDCRSNVLHETLGRFMVERGLLTEKQFQAILGKSVTHGLELGEMMILEGLITASGLYHVLQQNLACKLLDGFAMRRGHFRIFTDAVQVSSPIKVNLPQLLLTGIVKLVPQEEVNGIIGVLVGKELCLHPAPTHPLSTLRLSPAQTAITTLLESGKRIDQLAAETSIPFDDITRLLYSLVLIGAVAPKEWLPAEPRMPVQHDAVATVTAGVEAAAASSNGASASRNGAAAPGNGAAAPGNGAAVQALGEEELETIRQEVMSTYLKHRRQDAFQQLGLEESASREEIERQYAAFCHRFAPWRFEREELAGLRAQAEEIFLAGGRAFGELRNEETRRALIARRHQRDKRPDEPKISQFAIRSPLLDPARRFKKGMVLLEKGALQEAIAEIEFAHDCDPQNLTYRAELAHCRFLAVPETAERGLTELREILRIEASFGLALYYAGQIHAALGNLDEARMYLQRSIKQLAPDRRPIEALRQLSHATKKRRARVVPELASRLAAQLF